MTRQIIIIILLGLISCNRASEKAARILEQDRMKDIISDITLAETYVEFFLNKDTTLSKDTLLKREIEKVLAFHKTDVKTFSSSYKYYKSHPELFKLIIDSASTTFMQYNKSQLNSDITPLQPEKTTPKSIAPTIKENKNRSTPSKYLLKEKQNL